MKLQPYNITLYVYAEDEQEAKALEQDLLDFVRNKYNQGVYPRAAALSGLIKRYGNNTIINNFIR